MIAKGYLKCRMEKSVSSHAIVVYVPYDPQDLTKNTQSNLMAVDEFKNLGFAEENKTSTSLPSDGGEATATESVDDGKQAS